MAQLVKHLPAMWRPRFDPWVRKIPLRMKWHPTPVFLPGEFYGWRSMVDYSPWGRKELDTTKRFHFHFFFILSLNKCLITYICVQNWASYYRDYYEVQHILLDLKRDKIG